MCVYEEALAIAPPAKGEDAYVCLDLGSNGGSPHSWMRERTCDR